MSKKSIEEFINSSNMDHQFSLEFQQRHRENPDLPPGEQKVIFTAYIRTGINTVDGMKTPNNGGPVVIETTFAAMKKLIETGDIYNESPNKPMTLPD